MSRPNSVATVILLGSGSWDGWHVAETSTPHCDRPRDPRSSTPHLMFETSVWFLKQTSFWGEAGFGPGLKHHGKTEFSIFSVVFESQIPNTAINGLHTVYNVYIVLIVHTVCTNHTAQTALHCLKSSSMFAFTYCKGRLGKLSKTT